jgi:hypothetical protein
MHANCTTLDQHLELDSGSEPRRFGGRRTDLQQFRPVDESDVHTQ